MKLLLPKTFIKFLFVAMLFVGQIVVGQTNPTAQSLPYTQNFSSFTGLITTYPAGFQGWDVAGSLSTSYVTTAPSTDRALTAGTNALTVRGIWDIVGKMGISSTGSALSTTCLAVNTTNLTSIVVSFVAATQRTENSRTNELGLQYRVGTSGVFTDVASSTYQNQLSPTNTSGTNSVNPSSISVTLPIGANNQSVVQIRWMIRDVSGSGNRPTFSIDDVSISGTSAGITSTTSGNWSSTSTWVGGVVPNSAANAIIATGHVVTLDTTTGGINTRNSGVTTTIDAGGTLATNVQYINNGATTINGTFQLNAGGFTNSGNNFVYGAASSLNFNNTSSYSVNNTDQYWPTTSGPFNVSVLQGGMTLNSGANRLVAGTFQTSAGVTLSSATLTLNGIARINTGGFFNNSPTYGSASTLLYNGGAAFGRGSEWTTATSGAGYPANVQISNPGTVTTLNMGSSSAQCSGNITILASTILNTTSSSLTVLGNVLNNGTMALNGDVNARGNWTLAASATQTNNNRAVFFNAATGNQTITRTGGGNVFFDYLVVDKAAGNVVLSSSPATNVTINTTAGDVLQILNAGNLDLNGQTLTLNNNGGNIDVNAAGRIIISTIAGGTLAIAGNKAVAGLGTLVMAANVTIVATAGMDFGPSRTTVNGIFQINGGGFTNNNAPIYGNASTLVYNGVTFGVGNEWTGNATSAGQGTPQNVTLTNSTVNMPSAARSLAGNLTIGAGSTLNLNSAFGSDLNIGGNWINSGTFVPNTRLVEFRGITAQTLTGATTFDFLTLNNSTGLTLQPSSAVTVNQTLTLTSGRLTIGTNNLTVGGSLTGFSNSNYIVTNNSGLLRRTVAASNITFPVGNTTSIYNPITFNNSGTSDTYGVRVLNTVPAGANPTKTITRQWITTEAVAGGSNLLVVAQYNTGEIGAGFAAATDNFIGHYNGTVYSQQVAATQAGANPFTVSSNSNLTPIDLTTGTQYFAIGRDNGLLSVPSRYIVNTITPSSPTAGSGFNATITVQDNYNTNAILTTSSNFSLTSNGNAGVISGTTSGTIPSGTSSVVVSGIILPNSGTGATLTATNTSGVVVSTPGTSATFTVQSAASQLAFGTAPPATGNVGVNLTAFTVQARRPDNSLDNTYTGTVTITKLTGSGILTGTTANAVAGIATFNVSQFDAADTYTISASATGLTAVSSGNIVVTLAPVTLYLHNFNTGATASPYTVLPTATTGSPTGILNSLFSNATSWVSSDGSFTNFGGNLGQSLVITPANGTTSSMTLTLNVANGYKTTLTSFDFWSRKTTNGPNINSVSVNGSQILGSTSVSTSGTFLGATSISNSNNLTGPITIVINLTAPSGASQNFRLDEFTLSGNIVCATPTAYTVTGGGAICVGSAGTVVGLSNSELGINYQLKEGSNNVGTPVAGTGSALNFGNQNAVGTYTVVATNSYCSASTIMTGTAIISAGATTTWTGSSWDNGAPTSLTTAIIAANYSELADITACTLTVNISAVVLIPSGKNVTLNGALTVTSPATFTLSNTANLVQSTNSTNTGNIIVNRNSSLLKRLDYTLWSSPVTGQGLYAFSKFTLPNRFYVYNTATDAYSNSVGFSLTNLQYPSPLVSPNGVDGTDSNDVAFTNGIGYLIRVPYNHPTAPTVYNGVFTGVANNGTIAPTVSTSLNGFNAVGNPYPSRLNVADFIDGNTNITGPLYFWRKTNDNSSTSYATLTKTAYVANGASGGDTGTGFFQTLLDNPSGNPADWVINIGQGFVVKATSGSTISFTNSMRRSSNANQFFRTSQTVNAANNGLYWLNLTDNTGIYSQMAVGYSSEGTLGFDRGIDGENINNEFYLTSLIGTNEYSIQGRSDFDSSDMVPLSYKAVTAGNYTISIDHTAGGFTASEQAIYIKDLATNTQHDLKMGAYTFTSAVGTFNNRFEIVYQTQLGIDSPTFDANNLIIYNQNSEFVVNSGNTIMNSIKVFDVRGRLLQEKNNINASQTTIGSRLANQVLLVQITSDLGVVVTKKVVR